MDPHDPILRGFPLVARARPACPSLAARLAALADMADRATREADPARCSAVSNLAALIASDVGLPGLAHDVCHQHATAYLARGWPMPAATAVHALEPIVNLARLRIRAGAPDDGRRLLQELHQAVATATSIDIDGITVPADLTATDDDRRTVQAWLWRVVLADGTRTFTCQGQWNQALAHLDHHRGVGLRMFDGRQVAIIAALVTGNTHRATTLITETAAGEPSENAVTLGLAILCRREGDHSSAEQAADLTALRHIYELPVASGLFDIRLGCLIIEMAGHERPGQSREIVDLMFSQVSSDRDGYAARTVLSCPLAAGIASPSQIRDCQDIVRASGLGAGSLTYGHQVTLASAVSACVDVIRVSRRQADPVSHRFET